MLTPLEALPGQERSLLEVGRAIASQIRPMRPPVVGALLITCSDETEGECAEAFQQQVVQPLLPQLKFSRRAPFRTANLGGRYEWGAIRLAEAHFAAPVEKSAGKVLVVKINAHVGCEAVAPAAGLHQPMASPPVFGKRRRYGRELPCCGAIDALMAGSRLPPAEDLREALESEGRDRLAVLRDPERVPPALSPLYGALASARVQARKVVLDIQDYSPDSPTYYLVLPCVTLNRTERDTEVLCGVYVIDARDGLREATYRGLGDDPAAYAMRVVNGRLAVADDELGRQRAARDHREIARTAIRTHLASHPGALDDPRLARLREDVARNQHRHHHHARALLRVALPVLAEVAPVPAALLAFGDGAAGIHHAFRVHRLARTMDGDAEARGILDDLHRRIDSMPGDRAEALVELLARDYRQ